MDRRKKKSSGTTSNNGIYMDFKEIIREFVLCYLHAKAFYRARAVNRDKPLDKKRRGRPSISRKSVSLDHIRIPDVIFGPSEKPICSLQGHSDVVLDLSWSKCQFKCSIQLTIDFSSVDL